MRAVKSPVRRRNTEQGKGKQERSIPAAIIPQGKGKSKRYETDHDNGLE